MIALKSVPGPWAIFHDHPNPETAKGMATIRTAGTKRHEGDVCEIFLQDFPGETGERMRATAKLVAAAPDLYAALALFVEQWNACGPNSDFGRYFGNVRDAAVKALAKAEGESA